ncbi:MAG: hypothetical protein JNK05_38030 [Myxococcales bacterium]|nr:hypothetical protein [Myxococcales bacterium]
MILASCAPRVARVTPRAWSAEHTPPPTDAATPMAVAEPCSGRRGPVRAQWGPLVWSDEALDLVVNRTHVVAAGHRVRRSATGEECVSEQRFASEIVSAAELRDGWLFLTRDGLLSHARSFTGPLERVAEVAVRPPDDRSRQGPIVQRDALAWVDAQRHVWIATDAGGARRAADVPLGDEALEARCECATHCTIETEAALRFVTRDGGRSWLGPFERSEADSIAGRCPASAPSRDASPTVEPTYAMSLRWADDIARSPALRAAIARAPATAELRRWGDALALVQHPSALLVTRFVRDPQGRWTEDASFEAPIGLLEQTEFANDGRTIVGAGHCVEGFDDAHARERCVVRLERGEPRVDTVLLEEAPDDVYFRNGALVYSSDGSVRARDLRTGRTSTLFRARGVYDLGLSVGSDDSLTVVERSDFGRARCVRRSLDGRRFSDCAALPGSATSVSFADAHNGVAIGDTFDDLWRTRDGVSWTRVELPLDGVLRAVRAPLAACRDGACFVGPWWLSDRGGRETHTLASYITPDTPVRLQEEAPLADGALVAVSVHVRNGAALYNARTVHEGPIALWTGVGSRVELRGARGDLELRWGDGRSTRWRGDEATPDARAALLAVNAEGVLFALELRRQGAMSYELPTQLRWGPHGGVVRGIGVMAENAQWIATIDAGPMLLEQDGRVRRYDREGTLVGQRVVRGAVGLARRADTVGVVRATIEGAVEFVDLRGARTPWMASVWPTFCDRHGLVASDWMVVRAALRATSNDQYYLPAANPIATLAVRDRACIARLTADGTWDERPRYGVAVPSYTSASNDAAIAIEPDPSHPGQLRAFDHARALRLLVR